MEAKSGTINRRAPLITAGIFLGVGLGGLLMEFYCIRSSSGITCLVAFDL